jgi:hypothetical protein
MASVWLLAACGGDTDLIVSPLRPGSGSGSGSGTGPGTGCAALAQCCATSLPPQAQAGCDQLIAAGDVNECDLALTELGQAGYCATPGSGSGSGAPDCEMLDACCSLLPSASFASCQAVVSAGNDATCAANYASVQAAGYCTASPPPSANCSQLSACCSSLPEVDQGECEALAQADDDAQCTTALAELAQAGDCVEVGGSGPGG